MLHRARSRWSATLALGLFAASFASAQNNAAPSAAKPEAKTEAKNTPDAPADSITEGSVKVGGQTSIAPSPGPSQSVLLIRKMP